MRTRDDIMSTEPDYRGGPHWLYTPEAKAAYAALRQRQIDQQVDDAISDILSGEAQARSDAQRDVEDERR